jgi:hypothetical protein
MIFDERIVQKLKQVKLIDSEGNVNQEFLLLQLQLENNKV